MNPNYGREKRISNFNANTMCNSQFPFECQRQIINYQGNFPFNVLFKNFKSSKKFYNFDFQSLANRSKNKNLKENGSLSKKDFDDKEKKIKSSISNNQ
jgi:hypothetical protein